MAFCGKCGAQLEGNERFCRQCGHDLSDAGAAAAPVAAPFAPYPAAPFVAPPPQFYPVPGQIPIVTMPQPVPKSHGWLWGAIIVVGILAGLYYIGKNDQNQTQPGTAPQPAGTQPGGPNAALLRQQIFTSQWRVTSGDVQIYNQKWDNRSNVAIKSASAECDQIDQNGSVLAQKSIDLKDETDPALQPGYMEEFNDFDIGQAVQGLSKVNCGIVAVTPAQ